jgi:hypothetical protein
MRVARERVADENDVVPLRRELAVGLVRDPYVAELAPRVERQRVGQVDELRRDRPDRAGLGDRRFVFV